jgi:hypothetical protein
VPIDYYPQKSLSELKVLLESLQSRLAKGAITEVSAAGVRTVRQPPIGGSDSDIQIKRVLYSLYLRALGTSEEPTWTNPYSQSLRRVRVRYTTANSSTL